MTKSRRYVDVFPMIFPSPSASPHSNPYFFMLVWLWVKPLIPQVAGSWICVLSQSYGKFISFDPSPYSHRKAPSKSLGQMAPRRYFPGCDPHRTCVPWSGPSQRLGISGTEWKNPGELPWENHGKSTGNHGVSHWIWGRRYVLPSFQCWENGENHGYNPAHIPAD